MSIYSSVDNTCSSCSGFGTLIVETTIDHDSSDSFVEISCPRCFGSGFITFNPERFIREYKSKKEAKAFDSIARAIERVTNEYPEFFRVPTGKQTKM